MAVRFLHLALGALLTLAAPEPAPAADAQSTNASRLSGTGALQPFFLALTALDRHRATHPLRIMQIGDSHTANDSFSGRLRERLQARFGAAGRGWLPAGIPFKYYRPALVTVTETGWRHLRPPDGEAAVPLGIDAVSAEASEPGAHMELTSTEPEGFSRFAIEIVTSPHGAPLSVRIDDGNARQIATDAHQTALRRIEMLLPHPAHRVEITAAAPGGQRLLGWAVERRRPGIIYENHGTIGATVTLLTKLNPSTVGVEMSEHHPGLLVIAFGTNEGFDDSLNLAQYAARFRSTVAALRRHAPGASVLVIGSPDGSRLSKECAAQPHQDLGCKPKAASGDACVWSEPLNLAPVRDIQRRIAAREGWAFWDWSAAMGGSCAMHRWLAQDPPLAMPDHVHLNKAGYTLTADALFGDLMHAYDSWKTAHTVRR
ncbi:MAG TPA: GDSL-type esterase/lipase family protein [Stellaceae bacterium]|jgi:lysophospholipase L1-like esterase|nr:GDSL-type esterase/lipase family protein [Stellaceae bacterium]